jgi:hypothetical protein
MLARLGAAAAALLVASAACASAAAPPTELTPPAPANRTTARLAISGTDGSHRVALWTATNAQKQVCVGWTLDSKAAPSQFTCLRRGVEPPVLVVETGGGIGGVGTHGVLVGLASRLVASLSADTLFGTRTTAPVGLGRQSPLPGWRVFSTAKLDHPTSTQLTAYDDAGRLLTGVSGAGIRPTGKCSPCVAAPPPTSGLPLTGAPWQDTTAVLGVPAAAEPALSIALASPALQQLLAGRQHWAEGAGPWQSCSGRALGYVLTLRLAAPATFEATLPQVVKPNGNAAYAVTLLGMHVDGANELQVSVDTNSREVVGVQPMRWPLEPGRGPVTGAQVVSPARDAGGPDSASCWQSHD